MVLVSPFETYQFEEDFSNDLEDEQIRQKQQRMIKAVQFAIYALPMTREVYSSLVLPIGAERQYSKHNIFSVHHIHHCKTAGILMIKRKNVTFSDKSVSY